MAFWSHVFVGTPWWTEQTIQMHHRFGGLQSCGCWSPCQGTSRRLYLQGYYGAASVKPTDLLLVHGPSDADAIMLRARSSTTLPRGGCIGLASDGTFHTSKLKEYPEPFCNALWLLAEAHLCERGVVATPDDVPSDVTESLRHLEARLDQSVTAMGPDYNPVSLF